MRIDIYQALSRSGERRLSNAIMPSRLAPMNSDLHGYNTHTATVHTGYQHDQRRLQATIRPIIGEIAAVNKCRA